MREQVAEGEIRSYYGEVKQAFALGLPEALTLLFSPSITKPMTHEEIRAWAEKFFGDNGPSRFIIEELDIQELGAGRAVVLMKYHVETKSGKGDFRGTELNTLKKKHGRWRMTEWEKLPSK